MRGVESINGGIVNRKLKIMLHTHYHNIVNIFSYEIRGTPSIIFHLNAVGQGVNGGRSPP